MKNRILALLVAFTLVISTGCSEAAVTDNGGKAAADDAWEKRGDEALSEEAASSEDNEESAEKARGGKPWVICSGT